jgi:hypothetical protein
MTAHFSGQRLNTNYLTASDYVPFWYHPIFFISNNVINWVFFPFSRNNVNFLESLYIYQDMEFLSS